MTAPPRSEEDILADIRAITAIPGYAHVVAHFCARDNFAWWRANVSAEDLAHLFSSTRLIRTETSTLIGMMIQATADLVLPAPPNAQALADETERLLEELHLSLAAPWSITAPAAGSAMREPIFYGGEGAYSFQQFDFAIRKYAADEAWLRAARGVTISEMVRVAKAIAEQQYENMTAVKNADATELGNPALLDAFTFTADEIAQRAGVSADIALAAINSLATPSGHGNAQFKKLNDFNLVVAAPILRVSDDRFLLFHVNALAEAIYESPFYWMLEDKAYAKAALTNRGAFTEEFSLERLTEVFGTLRVYRGVNIHRTKGERIGEIDVLVLFGDRAIVLQAKSKRLTLESRRGNDLQLRDDFKAAVQDAYDQSLVCAEALLDPTTRLIQSDGAPLALSTPISGVTPLCVVADHYPALALQVGHLLQQRTLDNVLPPLCIDIFALDVMAELLARPLRFLSYLELRAKFRDKALVHHEITLLGYHLKYNLWLTEYDSYLLEDDFSVDIEIAMAARRLGLPGNRTPPGILSLIEGHRFDNAIRQIEEEPLGAMIELVLLLYQLSGNAMKGFLDLVDRSSERALEAGRSDFSIPLQHTGLTVHTNSTTVADAERLLESHILVRKYRERASSWYGLCLDPVDASIRTAKKVAYPWVHDPAIEEMSKLYGTSQIPVQGFPKAGRNDPCPCGSGKKYKKCHLR